MRRNKFKSPDTNLRYLNINSHRTNNYPILNDDSDLYDDLIETKINNTNNFNNIGQIQLYNNNNDLDEDYNPKITNYFMNLNNNVKLIKKQNIFLQNKIKKYQNQIISKDNEIDNYKQKVRCLLNQVQNKNYDIIIKQNTIIKLSEEKDIFQINQNSTNAIINKNELYNLRLQLQLQTKEKEKYISHIKYLNTYIQKMNKNNIQQAQINTRKYNNKNQESEKSSEYNESGNNQISRNNINNNQKMIYSKRELKKSSFILQITGEAPPLQDIDIINNYNTTFEEFKKNKEIELNNLFKEIEEKNILLLKKEKAINDYVLNLKALKEENLNLKNNLNKRIIELNEYKLKYDDDNKNTFSEDKKIEIDLMLRENKELKDKLNLIENDKINNENKIQELNEDIENLKENIDNYIKQLNEKNDLLIKSNEEINTLKEKQKNYEKINSENLNMKQNIEKINTELKNSQNQNEQLINEKNDLNKKILSLEDSHNNSIKEINDMKKINFELNEKVKSIQLKESKEENTLKLLNTNNLNNINNNNNELNIDAKNLQKENDVLQKRVIQLNNLIEDLNKQINELNIKYSKLKKENLNLKEASQALLEKQKQQIEIQHKIDNISPDTHYIITKKTYNKLIWYLISIINPNDKNQVKNSTYENYKWVTELSIPKTQLNKYNKFEDDETKINDLFSYIKTMQDKLEKKEDELNKKNYENIKLNDKLQNKSSNIKIGKLFLSKMLNNEKSNNNNLNNINKSTSNQNNTLKNNANSYVGGNNNDNMEKYKNLLDQINDYDEREKKYQNEISKLKSEIKEKEKLVSGVNDIKNIPFNVDFKDDDEIEDEKMLKLLQEENKTKKKEKNNEKDNGNFLGILNDVPGEESDLDEVKGLKNLVVYLKKIIRDKDTLLNELLVQIKEMIKNLTWSIKNNQIVTKILTILGYTPQIIKIVTENKKGFNFDFNLEVKK